MRNHDRRQRVDRLKSIDLPFPGESVRPTYHESRTAEAEEEGELEALEQTWHFFEESDVFHFLSRCAPGHVNFEEMTEEGLGDVQGDATEEDCKEKEPFVVLEDWGLCQ